jgi:hypothetical protein
MLRTHRLLIPLVLFVLGFGSVRSASAGPFFDWLCPYHDCEKPWYSPARYWAPAAARLNDIVHGPKLSVYPPDRHPEITPTYIIIKYPCPYSDPGATIITPPTPPATSKFKY